MDWPGRKDGCSQKDARGNARRELDGLAARGAEVLATANEVERPFRTFSQWFRPADF